MVARSSFAVLGSKWRVVRRQLPFLPRALGLVWRAARPWTIAWLSLLVIQGMLPVALVYLTRALVNGVVAAIAAGGSWEAMRTPLILAVIMAALMLLAEVARALQRFARTAQGEIVRDHIKHMIHERATLADLAYYETPEYHDQMHRARADSYHRPVDLIENLGTLIQSSLTLLAMAAVLIPFGWWVPVALFVSTLPALWVVLRFALMQHAWRMRTTQKDRRSWYLDWLLTDRTAAAEIRLFSLGRAFSERFQDLRRGLRGERLAMARSEAMTEIAAGGFALVVLGATIALMVVRTMQGALSLGDLAMFAQAFNQGQRLMRTLLENVGQVYSNLLFLENLFEFLGIEPIVVDPEQPSPTPSMPAPSLAFRNITFTYPSSGRPVFTGFSLEIESGQLAALLGVNGAGKSTLFKLLCRFYDTSEGQIEIGGINIRELQLAELRRMITVLFQEPVRYSETVRDNVGFGDLRIEALDDVLESALEGAGAREVVERLPKGAETMLGTWFAGGAELSTGEWQRIALARAILRNAPVLLLDEPTSAMDSWAEAAWVRRFRELAAGRTAVIITHRLTTARQADVIHVMDAGRIVESGTHDELVVLSGRYAAAWKEQTGA